MRNIKILPLITLAVFLGGCALYDKTNSISPIFLDGAPIDSSVNRVPFSHAWSNPKAETDLKNINSIFVKPVRTDLLQGDTWKDSTGISITSSEDFNKVALSLAEYFHQRLHEELLNVSKRQQRMQIAVAPSPSSVILEIALTEIVLSRPVTSAVGLALPIPGSSIALSAMHQPHLSFAARFTSPDGETLLGTVADRRYPPLRIVDFNKLTTTSSAREILNQWARELAEAIEFDRLSIVEASSGFSLLPW